MRSRLPSRVFERLGLGFLGALFLVCVCARISTGESATRQQAQQDDSPVERDVRSGAPVPSATDGLTRLPGDAFQSDPAVGVRYRTLFRDSGAPYTNELRPIDPQATARAGSVETRVNLGIPNFRGRFPLLDRGFEPEKADIKLGPIFFKVHALSVAALASDNVLHSETDKQGDVIGIVRIGGTLSAQLTEGLRIATSGSFVWLPTKGQFGISGYGLFAPYALGLEGIPAIESQVSWFGEKGSPTTKAKITVVR